MTEMKAVFFDRDGTLNPDPGYLRDPKLLSLYPGVLEGLSVLKGAGFKFFVVTNQSGVGRGLIQLAELEKIHFRLQALLEPSGTQIIDFGICPHLPQDQCTCRKPRPKLVLDLIEKWKISPRYSYFVGDKDVDILAGRNAGLKSVCLVRTGHGTQTEAMASGPKADFVGDGLLDIAHWIVSEDSQDS